MSLLNSGTMIGSDYPPYSHGALVEMIMSVTSSDTGSTGKLVSPSG